MIYTFDLFDTLITRKVLNPKDIFILLEKKIKTLQIIPNELDFYSMRIHAERSARKKSEFEEISLEEIYEELNCSLKLSNNNLKSIMEYECQIEIENIVPINSQHQKFLDAKNKIIITDIYLDRYTIEKIIRDVLKIEDFTVYISSELRKTKRTGSLFQHVMSDLKINFNEWLHIGDNRYSDYISPKKLGIQSEIFKDSHLIKIEKKTNPVDEDIAKYFGCAKNTRINFDTDRTEIKNISASVIAPTLFLYVYDLLEKAHKNNIRKLYFLARDGQIMLEIAKIIQKKHFTQIECKYLYASRKAWHLASVCDEIDDYAYEWVFYKPKSITFDRIFSRLECSYNDYKDYFRTNGVDKDKNQLLNNDEISLVKNLILNCRALVNEVLTKSAIKRKILFEYLEQEGFFDSEKVGIVDVGWNGRLQYSLSKSIRHHNFNPEIHGFYFNLLRTFRYSENDHLHKFLDTNNKINVPIFESFVYATHGTLLGYESDNGRINPVLSEEINTSLIEWGLNIQQDVIRYYSELIILESLDLHSPELKKHVLSNLEYFFNNPCKETAFLYSKVLHDDTSLSVSSLVPKITLIDFIKLKAFNRSPFENMWWTASLVLYLPTLVKLLSLRKKKLTFSWKFFNRFTTQHVRTWFQRPDDLLRETE
ncbi:hypothetical protein [Alteromonas confluentis]|uniref:HAD family hydrolase n=1 Tax=Alteromonas confluentis TaxID=1656094 RepID=A0A1E7Z954_9ALTE|nr:hypothetical protein [Alteromonas confluentis]OFC69934.1 hypothetical protein BFC18_15895 [Alteromonas confluentis]